jgi:hypothetical protein
MSDCLTSRQINLLKEAIQLAVEAWRSEKGVVEGCGGSEEITSRYVEFLDDKITHATVLSTRLLLGRFSIPSAELVRLPERAVEDAGVPDERGGRERKKIVMDRLEVYHRAGLAPEIGTVTDVQVSGRMKDMGLPVSSESVRKFRRENGIAGFMENRKNGRVAG